MSLMKLLNWIVERFESGRTNCRASHPASTRHKFARRRKTEILEPRCLLAAIFWDGGAGTTSWTDANNWSNNVVPTSADDVNITSTSVTLSSSVTLNSLTFASATIQIGASISIAADQITIDGASTTGRSRLR